MAREKSGRHSRGHSQGPHPWRRKPAKPSSQLPAATRAIVERSHRDFGHGTLDVALNHLIVQTQRLAESDRSQQYSSAIDLARFEFALVTSTSPYHIQSRRHAS
jgi:hypothetical protein